MYLSRIYIWGRPDTTKLFHFNATNFSKIVVMYSEQYKPCWSCKFTHFDYRLQLFLLEQNNNKTRNTYLAEHFFIF